MKGIKEKHPNLKRNDPCICGSKKKFKKCCGRVRTVAELEALTERMRLEIAKQQKDDLRGGLADPSRHPVQD